VEEDVPWLTPPPELTNRQVEFAKMHHDTFKHIMTFSSGAIPVAAVVASIFPKLVDNWAVLGSVAFLGLGALLAMIGLMRTLHYLDDPSELVAGWMRLFSTVSLISAYIGVALFAGFAMRNFYLAM